MKEKRTKKDFLLKNDNDNILWVRLPDGKSEEEVEPINLVFDETGEFNEVAKKYILNGMRESNQCFITIMAYNLMWTHASEAKILNLTDDRLGHLRIIHKDRINDWLKNYLRWYRNTVEEQETEGSSFVYNGWIGFHVEMFPLRTFVGYKHHTPLILGRTVVNPNIDDNRCLQRCLILASEGEHKIIANRKMGDASVYNKWWKQPDKYKVFGVTSHEIEKAMDICDNKPFDASEEKYVKLEELLKVSLNVFEITLLPGYDDNSKDKYDLFTNSQIYKPNGSGGSVSLCIVNDTWNENEIPKHFLYIKDLSDFKHRIFRQSDARNNNLARNVKCKFCDFIGSQTAVQNHEVQVHHELMDDRDQYELSSEETRLRFINLRFEMPAPVVVYADFESAIDDKTRYKPIMLSCLAVSRIPTIDTQLRMFHAPHEEESDLRSFMEFLLQLQESVKGYLFDELPLENTPEIERDYQSTSACPFSHKKKEDDKVRHHAHVAGE